MRALELTIPQQDSWRNIAISLIDPDHQFSMSVIDNINHSVPSRVSSAFPGSAKV
jgi:hypothetical protein